MLSTEDVEKNLKDETDWSRVRWTIRPPKIEVKTENPPPAGSPPTANEVAEAVIEKMQKSDNRTFWFIVIFFAILWIFKTVF